MVCDAMNKLVTNVKFRVLRANLSEHDIERGVGEWAIAHPKVDVDDWLTLHALLNIAELSCFLQTMSKTSEYHREFLPMVENAFEFPVELRLE